MSDQLPDGAQPWGYQPQPNPASQVHPGQFTPEQRHPQPIYPHQPDGSGNQNWGQASNQASTNGWALCGLIVGLGSLVLSLFFALLLFGFLFLPVSLFGFIASIVGLRQIKRSQQPGIGMAWAGIVLNTIALLAQLAMLALTIVLFGGLLWFGANFDELCESGDLDCTTPPTTISPTPTDSND